MALIDIMSIDCIAVYPALFHKDCETEIGNVFTQTNAISKQKKIEILDWRQMKTFFKSSKMVLDFD